MFNCNCCHQLYIFLYLIQLVHFYFKSTNTVCEASNPNKEKIRISGSNKHQSKCGFDGSFVGPNKSIDIFLST